MRSAFVLAPGGKALDASWFVGQQVRARQPLQRPRNRRTDRSAPWCGGERRLLRGDGAGAQITEHVAAAPVAGTAALEGTSRLRKPTSGALVRCAGMHVVGHAAPACPRRAGLVV